MTEEAHWWQRGVIYQIYPRSFQDSNGDGIGDLNGITTRLEYLARQGIEGVWISPFFPSPMKDFGYDVADYCDVDPIFGTLQDFDKLLERAHHLGMRVILDFVPNHTSDEHPWFQESRSSRTSSKREWYIWRDPAADGGPPNNWLSQFGGPAWTLDKHTGQYYLHSFLSAQPDVNWRNPETSAAMLACMRFWLDRGVDGFRVDALHHVIKDEHFRDNPVNMDWNESMLPIYQFHQTYTQDRPELIGVCHEMRRLADEYPDRTLIGEMFLPLDRLVIYYGDAGNGLHLPFNFQLLDYKAPWTGKGLAEIIEYYETLLSTVEDAWPNWVLGNHDRPRIASRIGSENTRNAALLLLTLRGTPTMYYGDELGICDVPIADEFVQDPWGINTPGYGVGRDPVRTPMAWTGQQQQAGFTSGSPWLPLHEDWRARNVAAQVENPQSLLRFYQDLLALRKREPALSIGSYRTTHATERVFAYERQGTDGKKFQIIMNLSSEEEIIDFGKHVGQANGPGCVVLATDSRELRFPAPHRIAVAGYQGVILELS